MNSKVSEKKNVRNTDLIAVALLLIIGSIGTLFFIRDLHYLNSKLSIFNLFTGWIPWYLTVYLFINLIEYMFFFRALYSNNLKKMARIRKNTVRSNIYITLYPLIFGILGYSIVSYFSFVNTGYITPPSTIFDNAESLIVLVICVISIPVIFVVTGNSVMKNAINKSSLEYKNKY